MGTRYRAAVIGRTGGGDYGHDLEYAWLNLPGVELVAVADEDPEGLRRAQARTGAPRGYTDYQEMLAREAVHFVSVAPRWPDCHAAMVTACAEAGVAGVLCEKPFVRTPAEGDAVLAACRRAGTRVAVAHQARAIPQVQHAARMLAEGALGRVPTLVGHGKGDARGGGEDLIVLGTHILDLMCFLAGSPEWVFARVQTEGRDITLADAREPSEPVGPVAGDSVTAVYGFANGVTGLFESHRGMADGGRRFGLEVHGSEGILAIRAGEEWAVRYLPQSYFPAVAAAEWQPLPAPEWEAAPRKLLFGNQILARDLIAAVEGQREPLASGADAVAALEMIVGVYTAHLAGARVALPLAQRSHPLQCQP
ncbi:MAG: Gfo/Idh/MocA family oxidoreductase [Armatimonadetes bacterium]|nr:Gfo/Idh/MocA family oxidoreductase [Armatimonadota bacterium]